MFGFITSLLKNRQKLLDLAQKEVLTLRLQMPDGRVLRLIARYDAHLAADCCPRGYYRYSIQHAPDLPSVPARVVKQADTRHMMDIATKHSLEKYLSEPGSFLEILSYNFFLS